MANFNPHKCNRETMMIYPVGRDIPGINWHCVKCGNFGTIDANGVPEPLGNNRAYKNRG